VHISKTRTEQSALINRVFYNFSGELFAY